MPYFLPSFFQKRLLRYALSRLELVDTEALDLDSLGITWGQRSVVELRDVGLRTDKLSAMLQLPTTFMLIKARIRLLRVTVPADIYSSGITAEVEGVDIVLRIESNAELEGKSEPPQPFVHDPGGEHIGIPTSADLAQSFLQAEPKEEKEELQAAIAEQSPTLQASIYGSDEEGEGDVGLGQGAVSLPSFVAGFLKGVADRFELKITHVGIEMEMEVPRDAAGNGARKADTVSARLSIQELAIEGVTALCVPDEDDGAGESARPGKRLVSLRQVRATLVSDASVFSTYSRFGSSASSSPSSPSSPVLSRTDRLSSIDSPRSSRESANTSSSPRDSSPDLAMTRSTLFHPSVADGSVSSRRPHRSTLASQSPVRSRMGESMFSETGRFSDAGSEAEGGYDLDSDSRYGYFSSQGENEIPPWPPRRLEERDHSSRFGGASTIAGSAYQDSAEGMFVSQYDDGYDDQQNLDSSVELPFQSKYLEPNSPGTNMEKSDYFSQSKQGYESMASSAHQDQEVSTQDVETPHASRDQYIPSPPATQSPETPSPGENLSESKMFTHEEAESMYMSAVSQASPMDDGYDSMPGGWGAATRQYSTDNLHTAEEATAQTEPESSHDRASSSIEKGGPSSTGMPPAEDERPYTPRPLGTQHTESQQETPLSSSRYALTTLSKEFFSVDLISVWLPADFGSNPASTSQSAAPEKLDESIVSLARSAFHTNTSTGPGVRFAEPARLNRVSNPAASALFSYDQSEIRPPKGEVRSSEVAAGSDGLEVEISSSSAQCDLSIARLLTKVVQTLLTTTKQDEVAAEPTSSKVTKPASSLPPIGVRIEEILLRFLDHVPGKNPLQENDEAGRSPTPTRFSADDALARASFSGISMSLVNVLEAVEARLDITKVAIGHGSKDLLSFDKVMKMYESTRGFMTPTDGDISLTVKKSKSSMDIQLSTLPVVIALDVEKLDELFGWFGGLSSILELGNSIASTSTVRGGKAVTNPIKPLRGARVDPSAKKEQPMTPVTVKTNARIGGVVLELVGSECSIKLETSAAKLIGRDVGLGVQIDKARLSGPHLLYAPLQSDDTAVSVDFLSLRVEYLFTPQETDLGRLLALLTPSKDKYEQDDDIMIDTLFRQRRQGGVLRVNVAEVQPTVSSLEDLEYLPRLGTEMAKLATVTKYLPEDDRPGVMTLVTVKELDVSVHIGGSIGELQFGTTGLECAHIGIPSLVALKIDALRASRNSVEELLGEALQADQSPATGLAYPMLMARFIADEMDPTIKIKLYNLRVEYTVPFIMAIMSMQGEDKTAEDIAVDLVHSVINLADQPSPGRKRSGTVTSLPAKSSSPPAKPLKVAVVFRDSVIGLNPRDLPSKCLIVLTEATFMGCLQDQDNSDASVDIGRASIMIINDVAQLGQPGDTARSGSALGQSDQVSRLSRLGFVPVGFISSAMAVVKIMQLTDDGEKSLDIEVKDDLFILETCADSTQTLISIMNGLKPPTPPSRALKYRTEVVPIQDMLASLSGDAFVKGPMEGSGILLAESGVLGNMSGDLGASGHGDDLHGDDEVAPEDLEYISGFYDSDPEEDMGDLSRSTLGFDRPRAYSSEKQDLESSSSGEHLLESFQSGASLGFSGGSFDMRDDHFAKKSAVGGTAHRWDSTQNAYGFSDEDKLQGSPLRVRVRDVHFIWNLFDGYDWQHTRDTIAKAVRDVEVRATERRGRSQRLAPGADDEDESVIGDFLFNSIYIGIPANKDPRELSGDINRNIDDLASETGSYATSTTITASPSRQGSARGSGGSRRLRLTRSKHHKMTFELKGISADLVVFPPGSGETQSSIDVRVLDLEIFDHVPTSTWKKFATYMHDAGEREAGTSMVHIEILNVKPIPDLAASEIVLKVSKQLKF